MGYSTYTQLCCDDCNDEMEPGEFGSPAPIRLLRQWGKEQGWVTRFKDGFLQDFCPECKEKKENDN